ncbi:similar to NAD superfamily protein, hydrolase 3 type [Alteracholeplasma palmae J233]|uniref:Similar to NAD superfamily protein, hydrolase 3 type n=1 Tax=Alteracholeplasma palmae (strain ATCC 49389 / J233) TaxID=1318466 RepID=U4KPA0_ALTPJ|nr:Cof-type HAD-IIB family hydrolase [Alteracholeplasma palmae]CCV64045.1 similar to NAD superfamily protein, hydrolase 3 type [Alteracholeplasma palmae J233]
MKKYLIALDLDGTLLNDFSKLSDTTIKTIKKLEEIGHFPVIATGRPYHSCSMFHEELGLKTPLISDNGGSIRNPKDPKFQSIIQRIDLAVSHKLFQKTKPYLISAFFSDNSHVYAYKDSEYLKAIFQSDGVPTTQVEFDQIDIAPTGMVYLIDVNHKEEFEAMIESEFKNLIQYRLWGSDYKHSLYELYVPNISKASAINTLASMYGVPKEQIMVFGDGINDIEMLLDAEYGIIMENAHVDVKGLTKYKTSFSNHDDGVAKYLQEFFKLDV